jgi:hypothetical protein
MNVGNFSNQFPTGDYARPNLFQVEIEGMDGKYTIKAASLPAIIVGMVEVPYLNRKIKVPGDRTFADFTITVINDEGYLLRNDLLNWQSDIQGFNGFQANSDVVGSHKSIKVTPLNRDMTTSPDNAVDVYGWPTEIGSIDLSWETTDAVQEYTVTFAVSWDNSGV